MNTRYNITDIHREMNSKSIKKSESYEKILETIFKRMIKKSHEEKLSYFFEVPEYIFGYSPIKLDVCIQFLYTELTKSGFLVKYYFPKFLYISWDYDEINHENSLEKLPYQIPHFKRPPVPQFKQQMTLPIYDPKSTWQGIQIQKPTADIFGDTLTPTQTKHYYDSVPGTNQNMGLLPFLTSGIGKKKQNDSINLKSTGKFELNLN